MANEAKRQSDFLAEHDTLTEMPNRTFLMRELQRTIERAKAADTTVTVFFIDLDGFKPINDEHGHQVGDMVLRVVAERIAQASAPSILSPGSAATSSWSPWNSIDNTCPPSSGCDRTCTKRSPLSSASTAARYLSPQASGRLCIRLTLKTPTN